MSFGFTAAKLREVEEALATWQAAGTTWADRQAATEAERDAAIARAEHAESIAYYKRFKDAEAEVVRLRAALASVASSIEVATHRGWHHSQVAAVQAAGEAASEALHGGGGT